MAKNAAKAAPVAKITEATPAVDPATFASVIVNPDAELLAMCERLPVLNAAYQVAGAEQDRIEAIRSAIKLKYPTEACQTQWDYWYLVFGRGIGNVGIAKGCRVEAKWRRYSDEQIEQLRNNPIMKNYTDKDVPFPEGQARADKIVSLHDACRARLDQIDKDTGFSIAEKACDDAYDAKSDLLDLIRDTTPKSIAGLRAKAAAILSARPTPDQADLDCEEDCTGFLAVTRDLLNLIAA